MEVSKQVVAALLVVFIVVSAIGTWTVMTAVMSAPGDFISLLTGGRVSLYVPEEPAPSASQAGVSITVSSV